VAVDLQTSAALADGKGASMVSRAWLLLLVVAPACAPRSFPGSAGGTKDPVDPVDPVDPMGTVEQKSTLVTLPGCTAVAASLRAAALAEMNTRLDQSLEQTLARLASGCQCVTCGIVPVPGGVAIGGAVDSANANRLADSASSYSTTNNQVAGVDEADFVKNDGGYIYLAASGAFQIIDAWPAAEVHRIARVALEGTPRRLFVAGDRALVYSSTGSAPARPPCTYGYGCDFRGDGQPTKITVLDIQDRSAPRVVREIRTNASYLAARRIGEGVHTVFSFTPAGVPNVSVMPSNTWSCSAPPDEATVRAAFEALRETNTRLINEAAFDAFLPTFTETAPDGTPLDLLAGCPGFYGATVGSGSQFTTVLSLDMIADGPASAATIVSAPGAVYASAEALYMSVPSRRIAGRPWYESLADVPEASAVHKFWLEREGPGAGYVGSGVVKGHVLGQFAMDEKDGYLRIATSVGKTPDPNVYSALTVLGPVAGGLIQVGIVDQIAPTEDIRSVRFDGDRGYVVTFKKTDPLFVFDLADPRAPRTRGELKIPGFSTYMHRMDANHLLAIGYDADDQGSFAYFDGVLLQIFDVADAAAPALVHREVIGTRGSSSEALTNHLAFNYFAPKSLLMIPMTICEGGDNGVYGTNMTFSGLLVYDATTGTGFSQRGGVSHPPAAGITCNNWWTNAKSQVKRSIVMDDYVYSISDVVVKANALGALTTDVASVSLAP
jgi:hypothetical protein